MISENNKENQITTIGLEPGSGFLLYAQMLS
jgi:hypothetical protein